MLIATRRIARIQKLFNSFVKKGHLVCERKGDIKRIGGYIFATKGELYLNTLKPLSNLQPVARYSSTVNHPTYEDLNELDYQKVSSETLESLSDYFDHLVEEADHLPDADISYGDGVLTVKFGGNYGTYVINRQVPNKQLWLSSPTSGPKRYDFIDGTWIYKHDGKPMHELLDEEIPQIVRQAVTFKSCAFGKRQ